MDVIKLASFEFDTERVEKSLKELSDRLVDLQRKQRENVEQNKVLQKEYDAVSDSMKALAKENKQGGEEYKGLAVRLSEIDKQQKQLADGGRKLQDTTARVREEYKTTAKVQNSLRDGLGNLQQSTEAYEKALNKEINTKAEAKANNAELIKLTDQLNLKKKDGVPLSREQTETLVKLNEKIDQNTSFLKENHSEMQKQQASIGDYKNQILSALKDFASGGKGATSALKAVGTSIKGMTRASIKFIATPLGAILAVIVGAVMAVRSAMKQSEATTERVKIAFSGLTGVLSLVKKAIGALGDFIIDKVLWAFEKLTETGEKVASTLKNVGTSVLRFLGFEKAADSVDKYSEKVKEASENSKALAYETSELEKDERNLKKTQDEHRKRAEQLKQTIDDQSLSIKERIEANKEWGQVMAEQETEEMRVAKRAIAVAEMKIKQDGESTESLDNLAKAQSRVAEIENRLTARKSAQLKQLQSLQKEEKTQKLDAYNKDTELMRQKMDLLITEQGIRKKTLQEQLETEEQLAKQRKELLKRDLNSEKLTKEQYSIEVLKIDQELTNKRREIAVENARDHAEAEIKALDKILSERVRLFGDEVEILENQKDIRLRLLEEEYRQGIIDMQEYEKEKRKIFEESNLEKKKITQKYEQQQERDTKMKVKLEHEARLLELGDDLWASFEKKQTVLEEQHQTEGEKLEAQRQSGLLSEENYKLALLNLEEKTKQASVQIQREKHQAYVNMSAESFGNLATIAGKESAMGKAMTVAQTMITTYQSATKAFNAMAGIPFVGPALGAVAAASAITSGIANVKQITAVKEPKAPQVSTPKIKGYALGGIVSGGLPIRRANGDDVMITARLGEAILNREQQRFIGAEVLGMAGVGGTGVENSNLGEIIAEAVYRGSMQGTSLGARTGFTEMSDNKKIMELATN